MRTYLFGKNIMFPRSVFQAGPASTSANSENSSDIWFRTTDVLVVPPASVTLASRFVSRNVMKSMSTN